MSSNYAILDSELANVFARVGARAAVLAKLLVYRHRYLTHGTPWPTDGSMADELGYTRPKFSEHVKALRDQGVVTVARSLDKYGRTQSVYTFNIACLPVPATPDNAETDDDGESSERARCAKDPLWAQFVEHTPVALRGQLSRAWSEFRRLSQDDKQAVLVGYARYLQGWTKASSRQKSYFPQLRNFISRDEYRHTVAYWQERASSSKHASGGVPTGVNYAEILEPKIQEI